MAGAAGVGIAALGLVAMLPVKNSIREPLVVLSEQDEPVFVRTPGYIQKVEKDAGDFVKKGDVIVQLSDPTLQARLETAQSQLAGERLKADDLAKKNQPVLLGISNQQIASLTEAVKSLEEEIDELTLRAPCDGIIIREVSMHRIMDNYVPASLKLCRVIQTDNLEARISLPQQKAALVHEGMPVRLRLWSNPDVEIHTTVKRVGSSLSDQLAHPALGSSAKGEVDVKADEQGNVHSTSRRSTVFIDLPRTNAFLADGMTGRGEIEFPRISVAGRLWRMLLDSTTPDLRL
jgi:multidrug resistance efflux pump